MRLSSPWVGRRPMGTHNRLVGVIQPPETQAGTSPVAVNPTVCSRPQKSPKPGLWLSCQHPENLRLTAITEVRLSRSDLIVNDLEKVKYLKHLVVPLTKSARIPSQRSRRA